MDIKRRQKYKGSGKNINKSGIKADINFDLSALSLMCSYVISTNASIKKSHLMNIRNLFSIIDLEIYKNDIEKLNRIEFIKKGIEARIEYGLDNPIMIIKHINGGLMENSSDIDINEFGLMSNQEVNWVNETVSESLKYAFIYNDIDRMIDIGTRFKAAEYRTRGEIVRELEAFIDEIKNKFRKASYLNTTETTFSLRSGLMEESIREIHKIVNNPSRLLWTGMQGFNQMTGGLEATRSYILFGVTGVGKSITLLNLAYQIKKHNKNYKTKDPTKKPVIVYMTMENSVIESVQRLVQMSTGKNMKDYSPEDIIRMLREDGELYLSDDSPIDIVIKYVPDRSVDTSYMYTIVEDLEDEGYETICFIQDHAKKIRSCENYTEPRLELGAVIGEMKTFATMKDLVMITNSHLNREAARMTDSTAPVKNQVDITRQLGKANVGESLLMLDNTDGAYAIGKEYDAEGHVYIAFNNLKMRTKCSRPYFAQPFEYDNEIKLIEDVDMDVPAFKESVRDQVSTGFNTGIKISANAKNEIKDIKSILAEKSKFDEDSNIYIEAANTTPISLLPNSSIEDSISMVVKTPVKMIGYYHEETDINIA